jgi:toxin ParE1/3/4
LSRTRVTVTRRANADLLEIWRYVAEDDARAADRLLDRIASQCRLLAEHPGMGPSRPDIAPTLRCFRVGNYLIFYRQAQDRAEIVRVVHDARDLPALFDEA